MPMDANVRHRKDEGEVLPDVTQYMRLLGRLQYLTITRPDIAYSVNCLSQFMEQPLESHLNAFHRILQYLKGPLDKVYCFMLKILYICVAMLMLIGLPVLVQGIQLLEFVYSLGILWLLGSQRANDSFKILGWSIITRHGSCSFRAYMVSLTSQWFSSTLSTPTTLFVTTRLQFILLPILSFTNVRSTSKSIATTFVRKFEMAQTRLNILILPHS